MHRLFTAGQHVKAHVTLTDLPRRAGNESRETRSSRRRHFGLVRDCVRVDEVRVPCIERVAQRRELSLDRDRGQVDELLNGVERVGHPSESPTRM